MSSPWQQLLSPIQIPQWRGNSLFHVVPDEEPDDEPAWQPPEEFKEK